MQPARTTITGQTMPYLTAQIAAWRVCWKRLAGSDGETRRRFAEKVGRVLGEPGDERAIKRGLIVLGMDTECESVAQHGR